MKQSDKIPEQEKAASVARRNKGVTVSSSPLNKVKLDLAIILVLGILLWLVIWKIQIEETFQFLVLGVYGLLGAIWVIYHARKILRVYEMQTDDLKQKELPEDGA